MTIPVSMQGVATTERTRVVFGPGVIGQLGLLAKNLMASRVFVVTDRGLLGAGHVQLALDSLQAAGLHTEVFVDLSENPSDEDVERCRTAAVDFAPDLLVGLGGGSPIDVAKGANFLLSRGGRIHDHWGDGKVTGSLLPMIAVPTTAGTGTEVQRFALISDAQSHQKMACGDTLLIPRVALLDPQLTVSLPRHVTACTGMDAIGHALETAVTSARNERSSAYARAAFVLACSSFPRVLRDPSDVEARGDMLRAATLAGLAIEHSMLGAAHAMANPLTARFDVAHGQAVGIMLPAVVRYNAAEPQTAAIYAELAREAGLCPPQTETAAACEALSASLGQFLREAELATSLEACGVSAGDCEVLGKEAGGQWTAGFNPRAVGPSDLEGMYRATLLQGSGQ
ncbi:MAG: alcohol dehydrogenase [Candidatus Paceibacteria bacterium]|jgi:alcohol dehydrogenase